VEEGFGPAMVELFGVYIVKSEEMWEEGIKEPQKLC
jgi:hypothetical protein